LSEDRIKELIQFLNNRALNNSVRLAILLTLYAFTEMTFSELLEYFRLQKSSLVMHIQVLEGGLVITQKKFTINGARTFVRITDKGKEVVKEYLRLLEGLKEKL